MRDYPGGGIYSESTKRESTPHLWEFGRFSEQGIVMPAYFAEESGQAASMAA